MGLAVVYQVSGDHSALPARLSLPLYRAAQEALTNVRRHAQAAHVTISLSFTTYDVILRVDDDGHGGPPAEGFGLRGLRERAEELGGQFSAGPRPPIGFTLQMKLPR
jgi:signal transduction histidine kinase